MKELIYTAHKVVASASFVHGGATKTFTYNYPAGTNLLASLACPSNLTIEHAYEAGRDLLAGITIRRGASTDVVLRNYTYDTLGRPFTRSTSRNGTTQNDNFGYNSRSELTSATLGDDSYAYAFDHIGNRNTASEAGTQSAYSTNNLNQYTEISLGEAVSSPLQYDADGNMIQVQTATGTWAVEYNAENRPVRWTNASTGTVITMTFDSQGRRTEYKSVTNGAQNTWLRFLYDGYLCVQVLYSNEPYNVFKEFVWDPTEPVATRPLVFRYAPNSLNLFYAFDGNKNVSDVFYRMNSNGIGAHYDYAPFGGTTRTHSDSSASFDIVALNPFRFSSEYYDSELDLVYYNYRHYSPSIGRFLSRDPIEEQGGWNLYVFVKNAAVVRFDIKGKECCLITVHPQWFEKKDTKSWGGHSIFTCGEGASNVGAAYVSYFPKDEDNPTPKHTLEDDTEKYGIILSDLPKDGSTKTTSKGFKVSQICFSTDCVEISKAVSYIQDVFESEEFEPWSLFGNNCADNAAAAIAAGLPPQKIPKCRRCEVVADLLMSKDFIVFPVTLEMNMRRLKANQCQRYVCRKKPKRL